MQVFFPLPFKMNLVYDLLFVVVYMCIINYIRKVIVFRISTVHNDFKLQHGTYYEIIVVRVSWSRRPSKHGKPMKEYSFHAM